MLLAGDVQLIAMNAERCASRSFNSQSRPRIGTDCHGLILRARRALECGGLTPLWEWRLDSQ